MRKNPKPLTILVTDPAMFGLAPVQDLQNKGHTISLVDVGLIMEADVIIGPRCWRIDPALGHLDKQLTMMVEGVRNIKYPNPQKEEKND